MWAIPHSEPSIRKLLVLITGVELCTLGMTIPATQAQSSRVPRFEDYPVQSIYRGPVKLLHLDDPNRYADSAEGRCVGGEAPPGYVPGPVNFAGHFVVETCTCGSGCYSLYLWDAITGKFHGFFPSSGAIDVGPYGIGQVSPPVTYKGEEFHANSTLLILEGCIEDTCDCGRRYYNWSGKEFKLILRQPTRMPPSCTKQGQPN